MQHNISALEPTVLWTNFVALNAVPRASKKEEKVIQFIKSFGEKLGLPTMVDKTGNVIIKKPASKGMEQCQTIALQSHLDMVHQKNSDTVFNFETDGIKMLIDGDWVTADGTTLGADNGIGVATIMALLASNDIPHPALEALFTIDEETGMTGAIELKPGLLDATIMLNLDTEEDDELTIGCAGGIDVTANGDYTQDNIGNEKFIGYQLQLKGLTGGHSGMDIHKGRGNANKIMNKILLSANELFAIQIASIDGGSLRNAIPRESLACLNVLIENEEKFKQFIKEQTVVIKAENNITDSNLELTISKIDTFEKVMPLVFQNQLLRAIAACPNGIYRMSAAINGLVQSSNNIARVEVKNGQYSIQCLTRSSVDTEKMEVAQAVKSAFELMGAKVNFGGSYPGWKPKPDAIIVKLMSKIYMDLFKKEANVNACHAGLECGILGGAYPNIEMISFGPTIHGAHSPDEKVNIKSVQKYWHFLLETLKQIPAKN